MSTNKKTCHGDILFNYCEMINKILQKEEVISELTIEDEAFAKTVYDSRQIDTLHICEKTRTDIEVYIYQSCYNFVERKLTNEKAFEIGNTIESIQRYSVKLQEYYKKQYNQDIPHTLINIVSLFVIRLTIIDSSMGWRKSLIVHEKSTDRLMNNIKSVSKRVSDTIKDVNYKIKIVTDNSNNLYKDIIAIISIFAGIILTFSGVFSFSASVLESIHLANFYKLIIIASLICIFMSGLFIGLFYFLYNIRHSHPLDDINHSDVNNFNTVQRFKRTIRLHRLSLVFPVIIADVLLVGLIIYTMCTHPDELAKDDSPPKTTSVCTKASEQLEDPDVTATSQTWTTVVPETNTPTTSQTNSQSD